MEVTTKHVKTLNPFRAGSGLFPSCLAGRKAVLDVFSSRLYATITGSPRNILVHGNKRMGKTCLLMRMEEISFTKKLLTISTITSPDTLKQFVENISMRLYAELRSQELLSNGECSDAMESLQALHATVSSAELEMAFVRLLQCAWRAIETKIPALFITVDDIDVLDDPSKALLFIYSVTNSLYRKNCPIIFALSSSTEFYEQICNRHAKLLSHFDPIEVDRLLMTSRENAIRVPLWELGISFDEAVIKEIARLSDGFPFYLQHIAHYVFEEMHEELDTLALRRGYERAVQYIRRDVFAPREQDLPQNEKKLLCMIYEKKSISFSDIVKFSKMPRGSVASSLKRLKDKQMIVQDNKVYRMYDRWFGEYLTKRYKSEDETNGIS